MTVFVEECYGHASVQGAPMFGRRKHGVPPGGAFDSATAALLNRLIGNSLDALVLELAGCQLTLRFDETAVLAWSGPGGPLVDGVAVAGDRALSVESGSTVQFSPSAARFRQWVAIAGHVDLKPSVLLRRGQSFSVVWRGSRLAAEVLPECLTPSVLRAIPERSEFLQLFNNTYVVRHDSDRVGVRLNGPKMAHSLELPSEPACAGVIQITPEGLPIILGPDGPTIGGYPRAGVVISDDIGGLAQLAPGLKVTFRAVNLDEARS